ncbi:hypothetical protein [Saccharothrix variisporea]|uniref:Uncharacterized protein n=1 Tax=Saccharothrix variisporea TaxID=543527 RepID=A0A495XHB0_9PSEU|nr:hypothetical protein [Saccharothrix variisporea]RKT73851.1 hypothetical protein DFJ66_7188 [Saccharothrix variisporea]
MTAITMTTALTRTAAPTTALVTATRFLGHFLAALVGVIFLGRGMEH